jgi:hypothetical protein
MKVLRPERCAVWDGKSCVACAEDIELEKERKELEIRIEKIDLMRRALRTVMNENHDHLISRFPPEIASHIFIQYAPPSALFYKNNRSTPLYLGAVCQKWRQLAWATPQLWSSLLVGSSSSGSDLPQLIAEWLERSASLPLTVRFDRVPGNGVYHDVTNILNKHSAKWYDMHFDLPLGHLHHLHGSSDAPGNILRRLVLCSRRPSTRDSDCSTFSMKSKPSPTDLTLLMVGLRHVDIMWNNLTVASVDYIGVDECFERAPLLETLTLSRIYASSRLFPIPSTRIIRPHLHSLEISRIAEENVVAKILDSLCLPSLEQWIHDQPSLPLDNMISFIGCLSSRLKIFKITVDEPDYHPVTRLLCLLSSLEFLKLRSPTYRPSDELLPVLWASAQSPLFLPRLQSLEFACEFYSPWKYLHLLFTPSHWQSLRVKIDSKLNWLLREIKDEGMKILLELVEKGFDLKVVKSNGQIDLLQKYKEAQHF